ncbi:MAG: prepilin peptidase [Phycisphaerales bacterium]|nr:prepilin peptidase [Phycisphaerales bacterium]NNM27654.1 prepilin peptidase [Phycisphaerales bacterium]
MSPCCPLILAALPPELLLHLPVLVFVFCFGACVGSFLNVVIYRLPAGMSVISPPSRCPTCGAKLRFFRENLPIIGWLMIRGRCRYCSAPVSPQYMIIELIMGLSFAGLYAILFMTSSSSGWLGDIGGAWWSVNGVFRVWPVFIAVLFLWAGLVAMTIIDARTFTIPIQIPLFVTVTAFIAYPLQALLPHRLPVVQTWPIPAVGWTGFGAAAGGMAGVFVAIALLRLGFFKYSFADYDDYVEEGETLGDYPHARREVLRELGFLLPAIIGIVAGIALARIASGTAPPIFVQALGTTWLGYLVGGGVIWGIRIFGTLGFGREAMGLGDVHLLGAVGAVLGWFDPIVIFFVAPFSGIAWVFVSMGLSRVFRRFRRELPYGPHLALATVLLVLARPAFQSLGNVILPGVPLPEAGLVEPAPRTVGAAPGGMPTGRPRSGMRIT